MKTIDESWFSPDYKTARSRFIELVQEKGGQHSSLPIGARGPDNEALSVDIGFFGDPNPKRVLLHVSGTHGIEGFAGSAIQLAAISNDISTPPADSAVVFVHVLNPFGMAWMRRVNERNVDLNRNFLAPGTPYEGACTGYAAMAPILNPSSPPGFDFFLLRSGLKILRHGYNALKQAITEGQYAYPKGLFYGGAELEEGPKVYLNWLKTTFTDVESMCVIDVHTGLGQSGEDTLLIDAGQDDPAYQALAATFGERVAPWDADASVAYQINGGHPAGLTRALPQAQIDFITQEFGTIPAIRVLYALREENRWHHWGSAHTSHKSKARLLNAFRPDSRIWREAVLRRGLELLDGVHQRIFESVTKSA
ncbi:MAG: DUF2817 domain-containing protein [Bradymonadia bacterium]